MKAKYEFDAKSQEIVDSLRIDLDLGNGSAVLIKALTLLYVTSNKIKQGAKLFIREPDGTEKEIIL